MLRQHTDWACYIAQWSGLATTSSDFTTRSTHRLLVQRPRDFGKGTIRAEFPDTPTLSTLPGPSWVDQLRPHISSATTWSLYTDASWRGIHPPPGPSGLRSTRLASRPRSRIPLGRPPRLVFGDPGGQVRYSPDPPSTGRCRTGRRSRLAWSSYTPCIYGALCTLTA